MDETPGSCIPRDRSWAMTDCSPMHLLPPFGLLDVSILVKTYTIRFGGMF